MEDVPVRHAESVFEVGGRLRLDAQPALRVLHQDVVNRFGQDRVQRRQHRGGEGVAQALG